MSRKIRVAAIQMEAVPAPTAERLDRAGKLIAQAVGDGAQLAVLPELFNTGYQYDPQNYQLAETSAGPTLPWMHAQARTHQIHLAGTLMLREGDEIYNAAFVIAPDGRQWRYDKHYPWLWERAYFRSGPHQEIAKTDLGDLGMMICWDAAHPEMWAQYAGQVDALLIMSCPPKMSSPDLVFPDGKRVPQRELGGIYATAHTGEEFFPGIDLDEQTGWLGVPAVATVGGGKVKLKFSRPYLAMSSFLMLRPDLWGRFRQAKEVFLEVGFDRQTKVVNAAGEVISRVEANGDGYSVTEMILTDQKPTPQKAQPAMRTPPIARYISDKFGEWFLRGLYKKGVAATKPQRPT